MFTEYNSDFSVKELPPVRGIRRYTAFEELPKIEANGRVGIFVGAHRSFTDEETAAIDRFCATHNAVVFCDSTSNFYGKYAVHMALSFGQENWTSPLRNVDLLIHIGEVTGEMYRMTCSRVWRVSEDGVLRDYFGCLTDVFMMSELQFFSHYSDNGSGRKDYLEACQKEYQEMLSQIPELPFSNVWMAQQLSQHMPVESTVHLGIYNSLRSWNFFRLPDGVKSQCNVGGFGIDGGVSTMMGAAMSRPEKLFFGVFGDLAFFYDMNVLGNRHVGNNVRLLLINNGKGNEFRLYCHPCRIFGENAEPFMAAAGHYGNQSPMLVRHYAEDLGYEYLTACNKVEFIANLERFCTPDNIEKPIVFEVFTNTEDESGALATIRGFKKDNSQMLKNKLTQVVRDSLGKEGVEMVKKILGK